ncbi:MAG: N-acetyltransferase [Candidatus Saccharibacteria bacterium]|nr:N-acetyltransferase [Candidatus Saccharibacteria bacterium]
MNIDFERVRYRIATPEDQALLDDMSITATFGARMPEEDFPETQEFLTEYPHIAEFTKDFGKDSDLGLIAVDPQGEPVGAIWGRDYPRDENDDAMQTHPFEITLAVREKMRGQGIGRQLLDSFATMAWLNNRSEVGLVVHYKNPARRLYEAAGYVPIVGDDDIEARVDENYIPMVRTLDDA